MEIARLNILSGRKRKTYNHTVSLIINNMQNDRVAFVLCRYPLGISSMIINSINLFVQKTISVDIYISQRSFDECPIAFFDSRIRYFFFNDKGFGVFFKGYRFFMRRCSNIAYPLLKRCSTRTGVMYTYPEVYRFASWLKSLTNFDHYDYVIPVDCFSLLSLYDMPHKDKLVYYNMELLDWNPANAVFGNKLMLKMLEYNLTKSLKYAVLPSSARAKSFCSMNNFPQEKTQILPVAAMGDPPRKKSRYFRDKFSIPDDHVVILYSGNFVSWFQCLEIIDAIQTCRTSYALVMHTWSHSSTQNRYFREMTRRAAGMPVFFSTDYIPGENLTDALSSGDIGLAFYESMDDNCMEILFSSNKIGEYLKAGLPVITSNYKQLHDFVHDNKIGLAVPVKDISKAVEEISRQLEQYQSNAVACYNAYYRFESYFENFYRSLYPNASGDQTVAQ